MSGRWKDCRQQLQERDLRTVAGKSRNGVLFSGIAGTSVSLGLGVFLMDLI